MLQISVGSSQLPHYIFRKKLSKYFFLCTDIARAFITRSYILFLDASADKVAAKLSGLIVSTVSIVKRYTSLTFETSK